MSGSLRRRMAAEAASGALLERAAAHALSYAQSVADRPVFPGAEALAGLASFDEPLPEAPGDAAALLDLLAEVGGAATVAQTGGRYFGFVNGGAIPAAMAARWLADIWDQNAALNVISPAAAKLEAVAERWLVELFGLPETAVAGFVTGSSQASFCGLAAARWRLLQRAGWDVNAKGLNGAPRLRLVASRQAHGTIAKAVALLGFGTDTIEWVEADAEGRIAAGKVPALDDRTILILQAGNVNSGAFDDFAALVPKAREAGAWVHVDGAFGLWAAGSPALAHLIAGAEGADSWAVDGHKTLNTPYECGVALCADREALVAAMQASGAYIQWSDARDGMLYTPEMSRRARGIEVWAALKYLGRAGLAELVDGLHAGAKRMADGLRAAGFEVLNDVAFNQVLAAAGSDRETEAVLDAVQRSGECWAGGSQWFGRKVIRVSVCSWATSEADIDRSVAAFASALAETA